VIPWYIGSGNGAKAASVIIGVVAAALVGAVIGRSAEKKVWWSSLRQVLILIVACGVTYLIGSLFNVAVA
jgi:VIT1/CCC1 family predicted Fe2+/Mn2+ transporter